jgi:metallo-beta-lactamase family protein
MRVHFLGAVRTTTGSMHLVEVNGHRLLLDCGLHQGKRKEAFEWNRHLPFAPESIDACILSHAHIDHSGNLPTLVKKNFRGPIISTPATRDLSEIMLLDSAHLQEKDVAYVNKLRRRQGKNPFEPLYVVEDAERAVRQFAPLPYAEPLGLFPGVTVTLQDAGHILGSATITLDVTETPDRTRLFFTGDLGRPHMPILRDPVVVHDVDVLITESTYGDRLHPSGEDVKQELRELCQRVLSRSSRLLIPAFSVGRTQQVLYFLHELWEEGHLPDIPVYVDSPLSTKATQVYERHPECYDQDIMKLLAHSEEAFSFGRVTYVAGVEESKQLNDRKGPMVIISASGMCEGGRILHHLAHSIGDERNVILMVGFQAENTLGRRLLARQSPVRIFGEPYDLRAEVESILALSAHADKNEFQDYFRAMGPRVKHAFVVHGELEQAEGLAQTLRTLGAENVVVPETQQTFAL